MAKDVLQKARDEINEIDMAMAELFEKRMKAVSSVAEYKKQSGMNILDRSRENQVIERGISYIEDESLHPYYKRFIESAMAVSRSYQEEIIGTPSASGIHIGRGLIERAGELFDLKRRVFIITDSGVPHRYAEAVFSQCEIAHIMTVEEGEGSKSLATLEAVLEEMTRFSMRRVDCVVAVGGGVVGDLSAFAAATYMRGIDFYNIPTTLLSQVDSSVGGKCGVNLGGAKNIVGAFHQPKGVIIDPDLLSTLPKRHIRCGLAEAIKMALTCDSELLCLIESGNISENMEEIIRRSIMIKKKIVDADEREGGIRKILNFGHTLGHGIEAAEGLSGLYHGECVAIGSLYVCSDEIRKRLIPLYERLGLPTCYEGDMDRALEFVRQDKKMGSQGLSVIFVDRAGEYRIEKMTTESFCSMIRGIENEKQHWK